MVTQKENNLKYTNSNSIQCFHYLLFYMEADTISKLLFLVLQTFHCRPIHFNLY